MKGARPTFPHRTKTSQILHCRASAFFFFFFKFSTGPLHASAFLQPVQIFFFRVQTAHSNEPKLLPAALKISGKLLLPTPTPNLEKGEGSQICEVASSLSPSPAPLPQHTAVFPAQLTAADQGRGMGGGKNQPCSSFPLRLSWRGGGVAFFLGNPLHPSFPPHPSQCLCKPPRSYTQPLMPAQAAAPPRSVLLTRTVMSLRPPQAAAWRSAEAQGMRRCWTWRGFEMELGVRDGDGGRHTGIPASPLPIHSPAS